MMILDEFLPKDPLVVGMVDTIERRWGAKIASRGEQIGIEPQARDEADVLADCGDQLDRRETGVGHDDDEAVRQPALELENASRRAQSVSALCRRPLRSP
jgi:hypothetical protein